ncbi:MAG: hypothetical protein OHK0029_33680 [Armatimonadaceae bacterium]
MKSLFAPIRKSLNPGTHRRRVRTGNGAEQSVPYLLRLPPSHEPNYPTAVVLLLGDKVENIFRKRGWEDRADRVGFVVLALEDTRPEAVRAACEDLQTLAKPDPARFFLFGNECPLAIPGMPAVAALAGTGATEPTKELVRFASGEPMEKWDARVLWEFFDHNPRRLRPPVATRLVVRVSGLRNDRGTVPITVYRGAEGFGDPYKALTGDTVRIRGDWAEATFSNLPPDDYAVLLLHDDNANGKMDTSFGYPQEGFGASNNPKPRFGPPTFEDTRFYLAGDTPERRVVIRMVYL